jgi:hypothetical protein
MLEGTCSLDGKKQKLEGHRMSMGISMGKGYGARHEKGLGFY